MIQIIAQTTSRPNHTLTCFENPGPIGNAKTEHKHFKRLSANKAKFINHFKEQLNLYNRPKNATLKKEEHIGVPADETRNSAIENYPSKHSIEKLGEKEPNTFLLQNQKTCQAQQRNAS